MLVRFLRAADYASGNSDARSFAKDEVVDLRDDLAQRWINRGIAEPASRKPDAASDRERAPEPAPSIAVPAQAPAKPQQKPKG